MTPGSPLAISSLVFTDGPEPTLEIAGHVVGAQESSGGAGPGTASLAGARVALVGHRQELSAAVKLQPGDDRVAWRSSIPLLASRWGAPMLPAPSGRYRLELLGVDVAAHTPGPNAASLRQALPPARLYTNLFAIFASVDADGTVSVEIAPPLTDDERGAAQQARLEAAYRQSPAPLANAVFFESFYGQNASCNPLAIDREFAATRPDVLRYWSVADASVVVPEGSIALIDGSAEWWRIRGSARLLVVNDWLRKRYRRRRGQKVLQTWHGTPLKRIALTRPGLRPRAAIATLLECSRWDFLLAQNPYSAKIFRSAYAFLGAPWQEGYPRNDVLATGDAAALRTKLGIAEGVTVILYAPTWRDDAPNDVDQLDVAAFSRELGPGFVTLIRGHSRSLRGGSDVHASNVIDVTSYPDTSDLFLVADALVTDYSSVMFDYSVTGKPIYFYTPDLDHYRDEIRGFYFDLLAVSPGPVVRGADELVAQLRNPEAATSTYATRYAAWQKRFNPRDDGTAAARVVARILGTGLLDPK
ncbi:MAG: hypothetical protein JWQ43_2677 [Glaciihabitans sp.]|nr:hypothetical protein [Glaciihabitans sp.]